MPEAEFLTVAEVAERLRLNPQTVRNWIEAGKLPAYRVGRRVRIGRADFDALIVAGATDSRPKHPGLSSGSRSAAPTYTAAEFWDGVPHPAGWLADDAAKPDR